MSQRSDQEVIATLKQMLQFCHSIQVSLQGDLDHFSKNEMEKIGPSNDLKMQLLTRLSKLTQELKELLPEGTSADMIATLETYSAKSDTREKQEMNRLVRDLKLQIEKCYQYLLTNSKVVYTNLSHLNNIWDKLLASKSESQSLYDHRGCTGK
jgi:flagellar biosynthesis/type III secretory pathway chaperone